MKDEKLREILTSLETPDPEEAAKDRALQRALLAFKDGQTESVASPPADLFNWRLLSATGIVAVIAFFLIMPKQIDDNGVSLYSWPQTVEESERILAEAIEVFPTELKAIVMQDQSTSVLTQSGQGSTDRIPVVVELSKAKEKIKIVTFSGQSIEVDLGRDRERIDILVSSSGEVLIAGQSFVWAKDSPMTPRGYQINAQPLALEL